MSDRGSSAFYQYMMPVLAALGKTSPLSRTELYAAVAKIVGLTDWEMQETVPTGEPRYKNQISWALTYLGKARAVDRPKRATFALTDRGRQLLSEGTPVTKARLRAFPEYEEFVGKLRQRSDQGPSVPVSVEVDPDVTPEEVIEQAYEEMRRIVEDDILERLRKMPWRDFERLVTDRLLRAMGYGKEGKLEVTRGSGDEGVDGIISQDPLGLDRIYVQAKRYDGNSVQSPQVQGFIGALVGHQSDRGVFITTSTFTSGAREVAKSAPQHIELIDGARLAALMVRYEVGVQVKRRVPIYQIDEDFFEEF